MRRVRPRALAPLLVVLLLGACSTGAPVPATPAALPAEFDDGVPAPSGEVVLELTGPDGTVVWDLTTLGLLEQVELTTYEPFVEADRTFTGPRWHDVLRASGMDEDVDVQLVALDDYRVTLPTDLEALGDTLLATAEQGAAIALEDGGPIRIVFPDGNELGANPNNWIWSIVHGSTT